MELRISGREIVLFIAKFRLWDAYIETSVQVNNGIELRAVDNRYGCDETSYTLYSNGKYEIEVWVAKDDTLMNEVGEGEWELVDSGDIFKENENE